MRRLVPIALLIIAILVVLAPTHRNRSTPEFGAARVLRVVDGDTIKVRIGGRTERVRYIGIDTPESVKPGTPVQCYAERAAAANTALVAGREVRLVRDAEERDKY